MKKVIVISTSLRHGSNSDMLAEKFVEGAKAAGNDVEKISLVGKNILKGKVRVGAASMPVSLWLQSLLSPPKPLSAMS